MESKAAFYYCGSCGTVGHSTPNLFAAWFQAEADFEDASSRLKVPGSQENQLQDDDHAMAR